MISSYYEKAQFEFNFASMCKMVLPENLEGKTVLDIGCRRGKGVMKFSDRVGAQGRAIGLEWSHEALEQARSFALPENVTFLEGYPEQLVAAGVAESSCDLVFINSVFNLLYDPWATLAEILRVLKPGGCLWLQTVLASAQRDEQVVARARELGNSVQAAIWRGDFDKHVADLGFCAPEYLEEQAVLPSQGYLEGYEVEVAPNNEAIEFLDLVVCVKKPGQIERAAQVLRAGGCAVFPTDTVYGVGVAVGAAKSPQRIFEVKQRPADKPVAWLVGGADDLVTYGEQVAPWALKLAQAYWPGALTLIVRANERVPAAFVGADGSIGLRCPAGKTALSLLHAVGAPLATSSANISGDAAPARDQDLSEALIASVDAVVRGEDCVGGQASTVVSCLGSAPVVLREGSISREQIESVFASE